MNLVVGAGISGATIAYLLADQLKERVLVIDRKSHVAGNCHDYRDASGVMVHSYGSHIFHTSSQCVWNFLRKFTDFNQYMHQVIALIDGTYTTIPFNLNSLHAVFPKTLANRLERKLLTVFGYNRKVPILEFQNQYDSDLRFLAEYIYEKVFLHYTTKQWGYRPEEIDGMVTARVPVYISKDNRYFQDVYQGIPEDGYSRMIEKMLDHPNIELQLSTDYRQLVSSERFSRVFYTGAIDEFFGYEYGELPYRSVRFELKRCDQEFYQAGAVVNYPCNYDFTRIHEYKHYLNDRTSCTVIAKEHSELFQLGRNERYYPIPGERNVALYQRYLGKSKGVDNLYFLGRLGDYRYYDMDKAVARAMELFKEVTSK